MYFLIAIFILGASGTILFAAAVRRWNVRCDPTNPAGRYCPGRSRGIWRWVDLAWPWNWFVKSGCGYDLRGHRDLLSTVTAVRCPECGAESPTRKLMEKRRRVRRINIGVALLATAMAMVVVDRPGARRAAETLPTEALLLLELGLSHRNHEQFRWELIRRAAGRELSKRQERWLMPRLIENLRSDDRSHNADKASSVLASFWPRSERRLRQAMNSDDLQQRHLAAVIIRRLAMYPDERLLAVTAEELRSDCRFDSSGSKRDGFVYLLTWYNQAHHHIVSGLESDDDQQRLLCAGLVAFAGDEDPFEASVAILVNHLRDNANDRDAIFASKALYAMGTDAVPLIESAVASDDAQQGGLAEHIIYALIPELAAELPAPIPPRLGTYGWSLETDVRWIPMPGMD